MYEKQQVPKLSSVPKVFVDQKEVEEPWKKNAPKKFSELSGLQKEDSCLDVVSRQGF